MSGTRIVHVDENIEGAIYIGRAAPRRGLAASLFANPFKITDDFSRANAINAYMSHILDSPDLLARLPALRDHPLACWCRRSGAQEPGCHGDLLARMLARRTDKELAAMAEAVGA